MSGLRTRILPAVLTALGVTFLAAGLLTYTTPVTAETGGIATPVPVVSDEPETPAPLITLPPLGSAAPTAKPSIPADRVATRVRVAALDIDLPVIKPPKGDTYPLCDVAMWFDDSRFGQPGEGRATYLYAHARTGMFLPLLERSKVKNGKSMLGMIVEVWTSDDQKFLYEITQVKRHQKTLDAPLGATSDELWLQTSEGPKGTVGKLQVRAKPLSQETADHKAANPKPHPVDCE
jgi:hypothetical protein